MNSRVGALLCSVMIPVLLLTIGGCAGHLTERPSEMVSQPSPPAPKPPPPPVTMPAPEPTPKGDISYHVWGALLSAGGEQREFPGYAVYTYLLFNSTEKNASTMEGKRYDTLLRALLLDVKTADIGTGAGWRKDETNIFIIPLITRNIDKDTVLEKYDFTISQKYLAVLQSSVKNQLDLLKRLQHRPGPFLISLYEPLPRLQGKNATKMLYLDLTDMPADGLRQVLDIYKVRLEAEPMRNVEKLKESLRLLLLKYALLLDENLKIVDVALARFK